MLNIKYFWLASASAGILLAAGSPDIGSYILANFEPARTFGLDLAWSY